MRLSRAVDKLVCLRGNAFGRRGVRRCTSLMVEDYLTHVFDKAGTFTCLSLDCPTLARLSCRSLIVSCGPEKILRHFARLPV